MRTLIARSTRAARRGLSAALLVGLAGVGLPPSLSAQQLAPEQLTCAEMDIQDQRTTPEARQLYRQADRALDEVEPDSVAAEAAKLADLYLEAARLDAPCSADRVRAYRLAARLLAQDGAHERAQRSMRQAAEVALAQDRTGDAIECFLDAAEAAVERQDMRALDYVQRVLVLKQSHDLDPSVTQEIDRRLGALTHLVR